VDRRLGAQTTEELRAWVEGVADVGRGGL
jgi:hypothetical protein